MLVLLVKRETRGTLDNGVQKVQVVLRVMPE